VQLEGNPELRDLFKQAGISESQLQDKETAKFVKDFLEERGGLDAVKRERERERARPPPVRTPISVPSLPPSQPPPPPAVPHATHSRPPPPAGNCFL